MPGQGEGDRDDGFLGRWSRRKREAQQAAPAQEPVQEPPAAAEAPAAPEPEPVEPPSLDLIDKDFDLAPWLKQNVPESWKLAALRRAWESDPAIRDFENPARDYALDWNTPGGAPGYGPLSESDNVEEMLANIFGKTPEPPAGTGVAEAQGVRDDAADLELSSNAAGGETADAAQQECAEPGAERAAVRLSEDEAPPETPQKPLQIEGIGPDALAAAQNSPAESLPLHRPRRRGGSATPL